MITSPKVIATPTWPSWLRLRVDHDRAAAGEDEREGADQLGDERADDDAATRISSSRRLSRLDDRQARSAPGSLVFTALTIAPCIPSATSCVNSTRDVLEAGRLEPGLVLALRERAGDAADVAAALGPLARA